MTREVFGSVEVVNLSELGIKNLLAKVDTGAWSGALHCTDIHERNGDLFFTPLGKAAYATSIKQFETRDVKSASGHVDERYIIPITLEIKGKTYHTTVGLSDRSTMQREMLLGRKFLIENKALVDVLLTIDDDHEAEKYL